MQDTEPFITALKRQRKKQSFYKSNPFKADFKNLDQKALFFALQTPFSVYSEKSI